MMILAILSGILSLEALLVGAVTTRVRRISAKVVCDNAWSGEMRPAFSKCFLASLGLVMILPSIDRDCLSWSRGSRGDVVEGVVEGGFGRGFGGIRRFHGQYGLTSVYGCCCDCLLAEMPRRGVAVLRLS